MPLFSDKVRISVTSGKGGDGHVSFRREKFVPTGGPDGGDGGNGGSVVFEVDRGLNTLSDYHYNQKFRAEPGENGKKKRMAGKRGEDVVLKVPEGTVIRDAASGRVIADMSGETQRYVILKGGHGGNGNMHYATSTMQAPKYAQPGQPARTIEVILELKMIADVGLVGYPNVGKSTLLSMSTNAKPKIADYPFTTLIPMLGVVSLGYGESFIMADIPGLIDGAADGAGKGNEFLQHIERTRLLMHVVDASGSEGRDPVEDIEAINRELSRYAVDLSDRPQIIVANKTDLIMPDAGEDDPMHRLTAYCEANGLELYPISAATGEGVKELLFAAYRKLQEIPVDRFVFTQEMDPETEITASGESFTVSYDAKEGQYVVEGPKIEKMLGYTNLETEKGFLFFQNFLKENGILEQLKKLGIKEGDTVRLYGHAFEYYE